MQIFEMLEEIYYKRTMKISILLSIINKKTIYRISQIVLIIIPDLIKIKDLVQ